MLLKQCSTKHMTEDGSTGVITPHNINSIHEVKYSKMYQMKFVEYSL